jgi:phosphatidylglycerol lysyltransferase
MNRGRVSSVIGATVSLIVFAVTLWFLHRELAGVSIASVVSHARSVPLSTLLASVALAICSYATLTGYDALGLRYLGREIPYRQSALTSFMAFAVGHNVGVASLSGGSIRYRMYTLAGLTAAEVARLVVFISVTFGVGAAGLLGAALLLMPNAELALFSAPRALLKAIACLLIAIPFAYLAVTAMRRSTVQIGHWSIELPAPGIALGQVAVAVIDILFASATLYVLLGPTLQIGYFPFLGAYMLAMGAGVISNVPGGIGVFEAVLVAAFPGVEPGALLGTILLYRLIYYVVPLLFALTLLVGYESRRQGKMLIRTTGRAAEWFSGIAPQIIGVMVFLAGVVLLVSGASPAVETRLSLISRAIPLPVLELSHLGGSVVGMGLLILARGLYRRLKVAYQVALIGLLVGIVLSLLKGLDYEEASFLACIGFALWLSRDEFYRRESVVTQQFSAQWVLAIVLVLGLATWVGMLSYRHVEYSSELWWQFAFDAEAPRMLRASLSAAIAAVSFALWKMLRSGPPAPPTGSPAEELSAVRTVLAHAQYSSSSVALLGDKRFLWSADRQAFIMYQVSGQSWIAMGDPVGPQDHHEELVWAFRELVDTEDGRTVFYQVSGESLSMYVDLGLALAKLGEDATVPLAGFSLQGSQRADLRQAVNKARKYGAVFQIVSRNDIGLVMADLRRVSDSWLADKSTTEKKFSLGYFSEDYLANFDCAVVRVANSIVAFANLWQAPSGGELSVDLMRYDQHAPKGVMDYLFVELMLWGTANNFRTFNLGMAPLSGLEQRPLAPLWHKIGHLVFTHGENFYNFEGLRNYKEKFNPQWQPRYLACPGGWLNLPRALLDTSRLISGGVSGILRK